MPELRPAQLAGVVEQIRRGEAAARAAAPCAGERACRAGHRRGEQRRARDGDAGAPAGPAGQVAGLGRLRRRARLPHVSRLVRPVSMAAGYLRAEDERTETLHTFALYRITAAELATP